MLLFMQPEGRIDIGKADEERVHARLPAHHSNQEVIERLRIASGKKHGDLRRDRCEERQKAERPKYYEMRHKGKRLGNHKEEERERPPARRLRRSLDGYVYGIGGVWVHYFKDSMPVSLLIEL